jgi:Receptor family ligand binding region
LYLQLDPGRSLSAWAIVRILEANQWYYASLITEDSYTGDGFVETFYALTAAKNKSVWRVEDHIRVLNNSSKESIDYQLLALLENQSRVIILHSRSQLTQHVAHDVQVSVLRIF